MKKIACLAAALSIPIIFLSATNVKAEDSSSGLIGTCVPLTKEKGPWACSVPYQAVNCRTGNVHQLDADWKTIKDGEDAKILLKSKYKSIGGPIPFSQWLACQGFQVEMFSPELKGFTKDETRSLVINFEYQNAPSPPFPLPWTVWLLRVPSSGFSIFIDSNGEVDKIQYNNTFE